MGRLVGIDLGTTNSVVAIDDGQQPRILDSKEGKPQVRSVVSLWAPKAKKGETPPAPEVLVGDTAFDNFEMAPEDTIVSIKRLMGRGVDDPEVQKVAEWATYAVVPPVDGTRDSVRVVVGGTPYSPVEISAKILRKLKEDAEFRLNEEVTHAVITVPAYFGQIQRTATWEAAVAAGLKVMKILDEPTAAAIAFGIDSQQNAEPKNILVYDLGGGTFDVSVLMWAGNVFVPLDLEGNMWLGGDNFDQALVAYALEYVKREHQIDVMREGALDKRTRLRFLATLKKAAQAAKERLSSAESARLLVAGVLKDEEGNLVDVDLVVTRVEFESLIRPLLEGTQQIVQLMRTVKEALKMAGLAPDQIDLMQKTMEHLYGKAEIVGATQIVKTAVKEARLTPDQIDVVLMAGNATIVPLVQRSMEDLFGAAKVCRKGHPKHCVAMGAAILAERMRKIICEMPDPEDLERPCGGVNPLDATHCEVCGRSLAEARARTVQEKPVTGEIVPVGRAPFCYGTQTVGDRFDVFVKKNDPYETPLELRRTQTFYTQVPNQRMVSIPVYGGMKMEKASANEKQGMAFALLPPGLPEHTAVLIQLWLNSNQIFELTAHLEDGTDLQPWILEVGRDAWAVEQLQAVEEILESARQADKASPQQLQQIEQARDEAFECLRKGDFQGAIEAAERAKGVLPPPEDPLKTKAKDLVGYVGYVILKYGWALSPEWAYRLTTLVEEVKSALERGDRANLEKKAEELHREADNLPREVQRCIEMRVEIEEGIRPTQPAAARNLQEELEDAERALKARAADARKLLLQVSEKVREAVGEAKPPRRRCKKGHETGGKLICPVCGRNTTLLEADSGSVSGSDLKK